MNWTGNHNGEFPESCCQHVFTHKLVSKSGHQSHQFWLVHTGVNAIVNSQSHKDLSHHDDALQVVRTLQSHHPEVQPQGLSRMRTPQMALAQSDHQ